MVVTKRLANGLTVLVEEIPHLQSAAFTLLIPGGLIADQAATVGGSLVLAELISRGAGSLNSRQLSDAFESLGVRHAESASQTHFVLQGSLVADRLLPALELVTAMVVEPHLEQCEIGSIQSLLLQDLNSLHDNPARRVMVELDSRYYPEPFCRPALGAAAGIKAVSRQSMVNDWQRLFRPSGSILSIAGRVEADKTIELVERCFEKWHGESVPLVPFGSLPAHSYYPLDFDSAQLQIALAYPSAKFADQDYYVAKVVNAVLSGGMFGRLFIEVREKRGLCYAVYSRQLATSEYGTSVVYAGTTPERAQQTLDIVLDVLRSVRGSVTEEEQQRAKTTLKSAIVIGEESSAARANSNASDWWYLKQVRSLDQIISSIDQVNSHQIDQHLERYQPEAFTLVTLGTHRLEVK